MIILEKNRGTILDLNRLEEAAMFDPTYVHLTSERKAGDQPLQEQKGASCPRSGCNARLVVRHAPPFLRLERSRVIMPADRQGVSSHLPN